MFVGLGVHRNYIQEAVMDEQEIILKEEKIQNSLQNRRASNISQKLGVDTCFGERFFHDLMDTLSHYLFTISHSERNS
ncbi:MAG: hypothetical protein QXU32_04840 [Nitrososphaerales archaeon]